MAAAAPRSFGVMLKRYRQAAGLTQEALAERAGLSVRAISDLERGLKARPYPDTVARLAAALGLGPDEQAALLAARQGPIPAASREPASATGASLPPFVGRGRELVLLERHLAGAGPPLLLLSGEPGIGKSRLLHEARQRAGAHGLQVLAGGCQRHSAQLPYAPLLGALERHLHALDGRALRTALAGCAWLVRLLPELAAGPIEPLPPAQERRLLFAAVARLLSNVAGPGGTLLLLDDLQWADPDALVLLTSLLHSEAPVRVLGAYRDTEAAAGTALAMAVADLAQAGLAAEHALSPLASADAAHLLAALLPDAGDAAEQEELERAQVLRQASGVPFVLVSYAQALCEGAPDADRALTVPWDVAQGVRHRVAALPQGTQQLLDLAAVVGRGVPPALLSRVTARPEEEVLTALETAHQARLLVEGDDASYQFAHDLIREVIEADLGTARRMALHRRVAEVLERGPGEPPIEDLAYHYGRSAEQEKAGLYLEQAGDRAAAQHAIGTAEGYYRDLVACLDRLGRPHDGARAREKLGGILTRTTRYREALPLLEQAVAAYRAVGDDQGELRTLSLVGRAHAWRGSPAEGIARLVPVLESHRADPPSCALAELYVVLARLFFYIGRYPDELAAAERAAELAGTLGDARLLAEAEQRRGGALLMLGRSDGALRVLEGAIARAEAVGDLFVLGRALVSAGAIYLADGEAATSLAYRERAMVVAESLGDPAELAFMRAMVGWNLYIQGDWPQARQQCERALALLASSDAVLAAAYPLHVLGVLCLAEGDEAAAARHLEACAALAERSGDLQALRFAHGGLAVRDVMAGHADKARERLEPLLDRPGLEESMVTALLPVLAWADLERGDAIGAGTLAQEALRRATAYGDRDMVAEALRIGGMVAARCGRWEEAQRAFEEALDLARSMGYPYQEGRSLYEWGVMLTAQGNGPETWPQAQDRLEEALAIFHRLGARKDAEQVERVISALPGSRRRSGGDRYHSPAASTGASCPAP